MSESTSSAASAAAVSLAEIVDNLAVGEVREGQRTMAMSVADAIEGERHLIAEAGTGTGKSLAYLVPAITSGKTVVVATATKALQDQLAEKDLPFLDRHVEEPFVWSVLKGRSNYLCKQRMAEMASDGDQLEFDDGSRVAGSALQIRKIVKWAEETRTGDRAELEFEPDHRVWSAVSVGPMECPGANKCPSGGECFSEAARQQTHASSVIVVNLHLYGLHLASGGVILPEHDVVVVDEAHQLEDVLSSAAGLDFGAGRFASLARNARAIIDDSLATELGDIGGRLADALGPRVGDRLRRFDEELETVLTIAVEKVNEVVAAIRSVDGDDPKDGPIKARCTVQAGHLAADLSLLTSLPETHVVWVEGPPRSPSLRMAPIDVAAFLAEWLWPKRTVVLTSATLDPELHNRLGMVEGEFDRIDVGSPFDYEQQAMLYCALSLPNPNSSDWLDAISDELVALVDAAGGRTLALFTSWRAMDHCAQQLDERVDHRVLTQRELPKPALIREFTNDETSVLCATMGFWQGVDIPGSALRLVTIDRLPFPRPDEPLLEARRERAGPRAFAQIDLPRTATMLAQGAGRLIRTTDDRGAVAVLDPRLGTARYRWDLVNALPPMKRTRHRTEVEAFLKSLG